MVPLLLCAHEPPIKLHSFVRVHDLFTLFETNRQVLLFGALADLEPLCFGADLGAEVSPSGVVQLVAGHAAVFVDDEGELRGMKLEKVAESPDSVAANGLGYELVGHGPEQHHRGCHGSVRREH